MKSAEAWDRLLWAWLAIVAGGSAGASDAGRLEAAEYLGPSAIAVSHEGRLLFACLSDARQLAIVELPKARVVRKVSG